MRLININTHELGEFIGTPEDPIPPYVILSHTWGVNEVTYTEMMRPNPDTFKKEGYIKILEFASAVALRTASTNDPIEYVWVDTCCIDKSSSAELSEAINSMYRWYKNAKHCYVYLSDVGGFEPDPEDEASQAPAKDQNARMRDALENCRWMTRGWTLQELLANPQVLFFNRDWELLFRKKDWIPQLSMLLGIGRDVLTTCDPSLASVAQRMSWASRRRTTRAEDIAYCLLGIFDVSMPLLYGEGGEKAFVRLQEEIMKSSDDHSLFAWRNLDREYASCHGLLAASPAKFAMSHNVAFVDDPEDNAPFSVTNKGLSLILPLARVAGKPDLFIGLLNCRDPGPDGEPLGIYLIQLGGGQFARVDADELWIVGGGPNLQDATASAIDLPSPMQFYVRQNIRLPADYVTSDVGGFLVTEDITSPDIFLCEASPNVTWISHQGFIPILAEDGGKQEFLCYSSRADNTMGAVIIILMWDRQSQKFGVKFHYHGRWPSETSTQSRLLDKNLLQTVGPPADEFRFYVAGGHRVASADMQLGLMGRLVVIKVAIRIK
ncbi:putative het domain-containing protein [Rosellinia necatrix]|uniref:Putative het domain-containing protein n=1 Tax=Rosellinia necatrix TaxID=77044 RepID=A0A1S8A927_ROSNE|nr:putative het domain-containing protein [Rosellinia necatrix]